MKILKANPAGNITVFVLDPVESPVERAALAKAILADSRLKAEQVGFAIPPRGDGPNAAHWRLEMAGGEFCGNAARSFGFYAARMQGLKGKDEFNGRAEIFVSVSGAEGPVRVEMDAGSGWARADMPKPLAFHSLDYEGRPLPMLVFEGISHVIAPDLEPSEKKFYEIKSLAERKYAPPPAAIGVMFYDTAAAFMRPAVYVQSTGTMYFESSCGSGSAALGAWLSRDLLDGSAKYGIAQPGGIIEAEVVKKAGEIVRISIGGEVILGEEENLGLTYNYP